MHPDAPVPPIIDTTLAHLESPPISDAHPYQSVDPFAASISLRIQNNRRRRNTITNVDEIGPPKKIIHPKRPLSQRQSRSSLRSLNPVSHGTSNGAQGSARSSLESRRSAPVGGPYPLRLTGVPEVQSSSSLPEAIVIQTLTSEAKQPQRRNALDTTIMALEAPNEAAHCPPTPTVETEPHAVNETESVKGETVSIPWNPIASVSETRSTTSSSMDHHRHRPGQRTQYATFSEAFLPAHLDEKVVRLNIYQSPTIGQDSEIPLKLYLWIFLTGILPRQIYLHCLLRLPYMYFSRVDQIFVDANLSMEEIKEMALRDSVGGLIQRRKSARMPRAYLRLKKNWEHFIDNLMREWKTLNIISGLLLSGILTIFQIEGVNNDPLTRAAALCSLNCALLSLLYGCFFIIRFSGMRRVYRAAEWAIEAQRDQNMIWNVWVMLAMPAIWLVWSILAYVAAIMSFMWRIRPGVPIPPTSPREDFALRVFICLIFGIGVIYAILIINTLRRYGSNMDKAWKQRIEGFRRTRPEKKSEEDSASPYDDPSLWVDIIPPTPRASTPLSYFSGVSEKVLPTSPRIPPSFTRRDVIPTSTKTAAFPEELPQPQPTHSVFYSSPEAMMPVELPAPSNTSERTSEEAEDTKVEQTRGEQVSAPRNIYQSLPRRFALSTVAELPLESREDRPIPRDYKIPTKPTEAHSPT
ncbi:hypothetical protein NP233_g4707 [Leucocoprinus birnbaumii]|uniref:Uncharacterized protein n=1 Tax=Leucocoprinus birnbaumii TaxID=56174 RepID=A0AAD5YV93_9AGAR|nr:hypothetical protein NP233_g4707 [Leucocoprinus birnbaumii]